MEFESGFLIGNELLESEIKNEASIFIFAEILSLQICTNLSYHRPSIMSQEDPEVLKIFISSGK